jgi:hypothetical protein
VRLLAVMKLTIAQVSICHICSTVVRWLAVGRVVVTCGGDLDRHR